jgi:hypothetical protein
MRFTRQTATILLVLAGLLFASSAFARSPITRSAPRAEAVSSLPLEYEIVSQTAETLEEIDTEGVEAMAGEPECGWSRAIVPVAAFLGLDETQVGMLVQLLQQRRIAVAPIAVELRQREAALAHLLQTPQPDPALVGRIVLEIRELRRAAAAIQVDFLLAFEGLLDSDQRKKLALVRAAAAIRPVLPAFRELHLI